MLQPKIWTVLSGPSSTRDWGGRKWHNKAGKLCFSRRLVWICHYLEVFLTQALWRTAAVAEMQTQCAGGAGRAACGPAPRTWDCSCHRNRLCPVSLLCQLPAASHGLLLTLVCLKFSSWMAALHFCVGWWFTGCLLVSEGEAFFPSVPAL